MCEIKLKTVDNEMIRNNLQNEISQPLPDLLARVTNKQRKFVNATYKIVEYVQKSQVARILFSTSQPFHIIAIAIATLMAFIYLPGTETVPSTITKLIFGISVSLHFGTQFWMTFISGLSLYFNVARHTFGEVQKTLFPRYFTINTILSALTLITYKRISSKKEADLTIFFQEANMFVCFVLELGVRLFLAPTVVSLIIRKMEIEKQIPDIGQEIGYHGIPKELMGCPHYKMIYKLFRRYHLVVAVINIITITCTTLQIIHIYGTMSCI